MKLKTELHASHFRLRLLAHLVALAAILAASPLQAQFMVLPVNLAYLTQSADIIVQGRVTEVRYESLPGYPNIPTVEVTLNVENMVRGPAGSTYTFREALMGLQPKTGKQGYLVGQRLFLFLPAPSRYGLCSPIGMEQGRFHIARDPSGSETVANGWGNAGLFKNVDQDASKAGPQLSTSQLRIATTRRGPVALDDFVSLVRRLTSLPRIQ
jgi:hypothetical protein